MIPNESISIRNTPVDMYEPDIQKVSGLIDKELGGIAISDSSSGLTDATWTCSVVGSNVMLSKDGDTPVIMFTRDNVIDIAVSFTQGMVPVFAWQESNGSIWLRYFDTLEDNYVIVSFGMGRNPRLSLDDKRHISVNSSDVILAYIKGSELVYRQQRDNYLIERVLLSGLYSEESLVRVGMGGLQLQFVLDRIYGNT